MPRAGLVQLNRAAKEAGWPEDLLSKWIRGMAAVGNRTLSNDREPVSQAQLFNGRKCAGSLLAMPGEEHDDPCTGGSNEGASLVVVGCNARRQAWWWWRRAHSVGI